MAKSSKKSQLVKRDKNLKGYSTFLGEITELLESARHASARAVNTVMTTVYWEIGRRIVEYEQKGEARAAYGEKLLESLSADLGKRFGRGFGLINLRQMRRFYLEWPDPQIRQTVSDEFEHLQRASQALFPLPWSHYVKLLTLKTPGARAFYETEALRGGWSVRQLERQINSQFYERTALSHDKAAMLKKGTRRQSEDMVTPEEEIKDPFVLEFLGLKDEYSESDLEEALIKQLENFLLELGGDFAFVGRQKRLRIGDQWFRVDLLFFHRRLRCLVIIDLKLGEFTHADAGQMHLYLNYAREHWTRNDENPPVGLILCAEKNESVARYALEGLPNKVLAAEYRTTLPDEKMLAEELNRTRKLIEGRVTRKRKAKVTNDQ
ncbi:MAG TPA: PDDEXK nuclease domain-containing protein [Pyrinomonadaceae bacterium]|nr:PDDEXK nuclease domain-containing protein [Pyrinomonadaceae bacterium]